MNEIELISIHAKVRADQRAMIEQHAKDRGFLSLSAGLRDILDYAARCMADEAGVALNDRRR